MFASREKSESDCDLNESNGWSGDESFKKGRSWKDTKQTSGAFDVTSDL